MTQTPRDVGRIIEVPHAVVLVAVDANGAVLGSVIAPGRQAMTALVEVDRETAQEFWESVGFGHDEGMRRYSKNL